MAEQLQIEGMQPEEVYSKIIESGISKSDAAIFVGDWLVHSRGGDQRVFNYSTAFPASEPECVSHFARSFQHADWVDGESVVQAGQTVGEDGFNRRLHQIEGDLDGLGDDVAHAFECLAESRAALSQLLVEIRAELNRINGDIFKCCSGKNSTTSPGLQIDPGISAGKFVGASTYFGKDVLVYQTEKGLLMLPTVAPIGGGGPGPDPRINRAVKLSQLLATNQEIGRAIASGLNKEQLVARMGTLSRPGEPPLSELIDILPAGSSFPTADALSAAVTEREAAATRTSGLVDAAIAANFSVLGDIPTDLTTVPIEATVSIPEATRNGLIASGVGTVGALADIQPAQLQKQLATQGVTVDLSTAAGMVTQAKAITLLR